MPLMTGTSSPEGSGCMKRRHSAQRFFTQIILLLTFVQVWLEHQFMGEFDEDFNAEVFQELHLKILQERDGQWVVGGGEVVGEVVGEVGGEAKPKEGELEVMEVWISQSCYMEEDPKCHVKGHPAINQQTFALKEHIEISRISNQ